MRQSESHVRASVSRLFCLRTAVGSDRQILAIFHRSMALQYNARSADQLRAMKNERRYRTAFVSQSFCRFIYRCTTSAHLPESHAVKTRPRLYIILGRWQCICIVRNQLCYCCMCVGGLDCYLFPGLLLYV